MREVIGPEALKLVRFLTMPARDILKVYVGFKILTPEETLAILFHNNRFAVDVPETISQSNASRSANNFNSRNETFDTIGTGLCAYAVSNKSEDDIFSIFTMSQVPSTWNKYSTFAGIQIPKSYEARANCTTVNEHFEVFVYDNESRAIDHVTYNQIPPCLTGRYTSARDHVLDNELISVQLSGIRINLMDTEKTYRVKIVFKESKTYPFSVRNKTGEKFQTDYSSYLLSFNGFHYVMKPNSFIYSMIIDYEYDY